MFFQFAIRLIYNLLKSLSNSNTFCVFKGTTHEILPNLSGFLGVRCELVRFML